MLKVTVRLIGWRLVPGEGPSWGSKPPCGPPKATWGEGVWGVPLVARLPYAFYLIPYTFYLTPFTLYPTWIFARHQPSSYQTYSDVKPTSRKPSIKSTILEGQTLDLSLPGYVYKQNIIFFENLIFSSLAKLHHTLGIKSCVSRDGFYMVLDRF